MACDTRAFFTSGNVTQFEYVLGFYDKALNLKAEQKKKPEDLKKLDHWYQKELPKKIKARGKDTHLKHEELVQCMKWKLVRGKWRPRLKELVQMNTPRLVEIETKKAFRQLFKKEDLPSAIQAMCNLKGVGPAMASAVLAAASPETVPFMAEECLMALPDSDDGIDYTTKEYLKFVEHIRKAAERLNSECKNGKNWTPHKVELALWTHYVIKSEQPSLLESLPTSSENGDSSPTKNGNSKKEETHAIDTPDQSNDSTLSEPIVESDSTNMSMPTSEADKVEPSEDTNDSLALSESTNQSEESEARPQFFSEDANDAAVTSEIAANDVAAVPEQCAVTSSQSEGDSGSEPPAKKPKVDE